VLLRPSASGKVKVSLRRPAGARRRGYAEGSVQALVESAFGVAKGGPIGMINPLGLGSA
jgi:hypothetical protein